MGRRCEKGGRGRRGTTRKRERPTSVALEMEGTSQSMQVASEAGKGKETGSPPELLEGKQAYPHPDVSSLKRACQTSGPTAL